MITVSFFYLALHPLCLGGVIISTDIAKIIEWLNNHGLLAGDLKTMARKIERIETLEKQRIKTKKEQSKNALCSNEIIDELN